MNLTVGDEVLEGLESEFEGGKQLTLRPGSSSISSFSDSEEIFISDKATEEDANVHLQGINCLLGDFEPTTIDNQNTAWCIMTFLWSNIVVILCHNQKARWKVSRRIVVWKPMGVQGTYP